MTNLTLGLELRKEKRENVWKIVRFFSNQIEHLVYHVNKNPIGLSSEFE